MNVATTSTNCNANKQIHKLNVPTINEKRHELKCGVSVYFQCTVSVNFAGKWVVCFGLVIFCCCRYSVLTLLFISIRCPLTTYMHYDYDTCLAHSYCFFFVGFFLSLKCDEVKYKMQLLFNKNNNEIESKFIRLVYEYTQHHLIFIKQNWSILCIMFPILSLFYMVISFFFLSFHFFFLKKFSISFFFLYIFGLT